MQFTQNLLCSLGIENMVRCFHLQLGDCSVERFLPKPIEIILFLLLSLHRPSLMCKVHIPVYLIRDTKMNQEFRLRRLKSNENQHSYTGIIFSFQGHAEELLLNHSGEYINSLIAKRLSHPRRQRHVKGHQCLCQFVEKRVYKTAV